MKATRDQLLTILREIRPEEDFGTSNDFVSDGLLDSTDIVSLVATLDRSYGISIDGAEILADNFRSLSAIVTLLEKHGVQV